MRYPMWEMNNRWEHQGGSEWSFVGTTGEGGT